MLRRMTGNLGVNLVFLEEFPAHFSEVKVAEPSKVSEEVELSTPPPPSELEGKVETTITEPVSQYDPLFTDAALDIAKRANEYVEQFRGQPSDEVLKKADELLDKAKETLRLLN